MSGAQPKLAPHPWTKCHHVLVINAENQVREMVSEILNSDRYEVIFGESLELLEKLFGTIPFDAVIIDLFDSVKDFFGQLVSMKVEHPDINVILICNPRQMDLWVEAIQNGAYECLPKPINPEELRCVLVNALESHRTT